MRIGFIGFGNMARAIYEGLTKYGNFKKENFFVAVKSENSKNRLKEEGFKVLSIKGVVENSDLIFVAVKPKDAKKVLEEISKVLKEQILVSVMAGVSLERLENSLPSGAKVVRTMPNINVSVGKGVWGVTYGRNISKEEQKKVKEILSLTGLVLEIEEHLMDSITALAGSGPAFVSEIIDAFAQAGVKLGFPYKESLKIALYTFGGTVENLLQKEEHPIIYRDKVTSPAGTTIYGLSKLNSEGIKGKLMEALEESFRRAKGLA